MRVILHGQLIFCYSFDKTTYLRQFQLFFHTFHAQMFHLKYSFFFNKTISLPHCCPNTFTLINIIIISKHTVNCNVYICDTFCNLMNILTLFTTGYLSQIFVLTTSVHPTKILMMMVTSGHPLQIYDLVTSGYLMKILTLVNSGWTPYKAINF